MKEIKKSTLLPGVFLGIAALFYLYEYFLRIAPSVMTTELANAFHINATQLGVFSAFYYYIYTPMQLPVGILMDRYGPRRLLTFATLICALGAYLFAGTNLLSVAELGRFLTGLGSAFAFVGALKVASIWFSPERFATIAGLATSIGMFGGLIGDNFMTLMVQFLGWKSTIIWTANLGLILALVIWLYMREIGRASCRERV